MTNVLINMRGALKRNMGPVISTDVPHRPRIFLWPGGDDSNKYLTMLAAKQPAWHACFGKQQQSLGDFDNNFPVNVGGGVSKCRGDIPIWRGMWRRL